MRVPFYFLPTLVLAVPIFWAGVTVGRRTKAGVVGLLVGFVLAAPGLLFAIYYFHVFDRFPWFYEFRAVPGSELTGAGVAFIAGLLQAKLDLESWGGKVVIP